MLVTLTSSVRPSTAASASNQLRAGLLPGSAR
jgi:hypothetical protein